MGFFMVQQATNKSIDCCPGKPSVNSNKLKFTEMRLLSKNVFIDDKFSAKAVITIR